MLSNLTAFQTCPSISEKVLQSPSIFSTYNPSNSPRALNKLEYPEHMVEFVLIIELGSLSSKRAFFVE